MRTTWYIAEENFLVNNYNRLTIKELQEGLEKISGKLRSKNAINCKIKKLKAQGRITGYKDAETKKRALKQRRK